MKPHIYLLRGEWTCALPSGQWHVWPYGKGVTPVDAFYDWQFKKWSIGWLSDFDKFGCQLDALLKAI